MRLLSQDVIKYLAKSLCVTLPAAFTGKVVITLNFHGGTASSAVVGFEEGTKLT